MLGLLTAGLLFLPLLARGSSPPSQLANETLRLFISPGSDLSRYTARYLSQASGSADTEACLQSQLPQAEASNVTVRSCSSARYGLSDESNTDYLILVVSPAQEPYSVAKGIKLTRFRSIVIIKNLMEGTGDADASEVIFECEGENHGLYFEEVEEVTLLGVTFSNCGPGIVMRHVDTATIDKCMFRDNFFGSAHVVESHNITIKNSVFVNNSVWSSFEAETSKGLENDYAVSGGLTFFSTGRADFYADIRNCVFESNRASISDSYNTTKLDPFYIPWGNGGAIIAAFKMSAKHTFEVKDSHFIKNSAQFCGGAIAIQFHGGSANSRGASGKLFSSSSNTVKIENTTFESNLSEEGGAISINTMEAASTNEVILSRNTFLANTARRGAGALSFNIDKNEVSQDSTAFSNVIVEKCNFTDNSCFHGGSALSFVLNGRMDQVSNFSLITNCIFTGNSASIGGALLSLRFPVWLQGSNIFKENEGGAITLIQSELRITGSVWFEGNSAHDGGAIQMLEQSFINLAEATDIVFLGNHATKAGGALLVASQLQTEDTRDYYRHYRTCFTHYSYEEDTDDHMALNISFIDNTAGKDGAAIFTTNLVVCGERNNSMLPHCNTSAFELRNNNVTDSTVYREDHDISTEPAYLTVIPFKGEVVPGDSVQYEVYAQDLRQNRQISLWTLTEKEINSLDNSVDRGLFMSDANGSMQSFKIQVYDPEDFDSKCTDPYNEDTGELEVLTTHSLEFKLIRASSDLVVENVKMNLTVNCCNPGYNLSLENGVCQLDPQYEALVLRTDASNRYLYIKPEYYAWMSENGSILWSSVPIFAGDCTRKGKLAGCLFKYDDPDAQCADNRTGILCGQCPYGTSVDLTLSRCVKCEPKHNYIIVAIVVVFAVACVLIMLFNIGIPNELRGFFFYGQVVGFVYDYFSDDIAWEYDVTNVFGFALYLPKLCPFYGHSAPTTAAYGIILPAVAVLMIVLYVIAARDINHLSNKNSFDGIWLLTFIIYKFVADTCFNVLRCQKVHGVEHPEYVYYYNGNYRCFSGENGFYLFYMIVALFLSVAIILFPLVILIISFKRFKLTLNITDVLNKDLKKSCRWWASFDLFRRLLFVFLALLFSYLWPLYRELALFYSGVFVFFVFILSQPYTSRKANLSETLVLLNLLVVCGLFLDVSRDVQETVRPIAQTLLILPFILAILYLSFKLTAFIWKRLPISPKTVCVRKLCKMPFLRMENDCVSHQQPTSVKLSTLLLKEEDGGELEMPLQHASDYSQYREELLATNV